MKSTESWLKKFLESLLYLFLFSIPISHPATRFLVKVLFAATGVLFLRKGIRMIRTDFIVLVLPGYQLIQSTTWGKFLKYINIPQGITPVLSYCIRFLEFPLENAFLALLAGIGILALSVIVQGLMGIPDYQQFFHSQTFHPSFHLTRPHHTLVGHPLTAGAFISTGVFISILFFLKSRKNLFLELCFLFLFGLLLTFDRSYWIATFLLLIFFSLVYGIVRKNKKFLIYVVLVITSAITAVATVPAFRERATSILDLQHNGSNRYRLAMWKGGIEYYQQASLKEKVLGTTRFLYKEKVGSFVKKEEKNFRLPPYIFSHLHNNFLTVLIWYGATGLLLFLVTFGYFLCVNLKLFLKVKDEIFLTFLSIYLTLLVAGLFEYNFENEAVKYLIYTLFALNAKAIVSNRQEQTLDS